MTNTRKDTYQQLVKSGMDPMTAWAEMGHYDLAEDEEYDDPGDVYDEEPETVDVTWEMREKHLGHLQQLKDMKVNQVAVLHVLNAWNGRELRFLTCICEKGGQLETRDSKGNRFTYHGATYAYTGNGNEGSIVSHRELTDDGTSDIWDVLILGLYIMPSQADVKKCMETSDRTCPQMEGIPTILA